MDDSLKIHLANLIRQRAMKKSLQEPHSQVQALQSQASLQGAYIPFLVDKKYALLLDEII